MSLEFIIEQNCSFKDKYDNDLLYILDIMQKTYIVKKIPELLSEVTNQNKDNFKMSKINFGSEDKVQTLEEIENYLDLNEHSADCSGCKANSSGLNYGCYNRISYPISELFEQTIIENLPQEGTLAYDFLVKAMKDFPIIEVKTLKDFRKKGYTEKKTAIHKVIKKKSMFSSVKFSSDFYLNLLFFSGDLLEVSHMTVLLLLLGIIPHRTTIEDFQNNEYINTEIRKSLKINQYRNLSEFSLIHSMCLSVLLNKPLAILL